jgi:ubiquitin C-terminal hydrolase
MKLHEELNRVKNHPENNNDIFLDQTNQQLVFNYFKEDFKKNNQSIISDLFYGTNKNITQCSICNYTVYNYQIFFFLNFPLEEVRKFKVQQNNNFINTFMYNNYNNNYNNNNYNMCFNNNFINNNAMNNNFINNNYMNNNCNNNNVMNNNCIINNKFTNYNCINNNFTNYCINNCINNNSTNNSSNEVNILDCFNYDKKINFMTGENKMFCNFCKINQDCTMKTELVLGPEVLILLLNRGKGLEFDVKIKFTKILDLNNYFDIKVNEGWNYELIGVITHIGENNMGGHFIAYCKDPISNKWLLFNDAIVDYVKDFEKEVINFSDPYLLFYRRIKNN